MKDEIQNINKISEACKEAAAVFENQGFDEVISSMESVIRKVDRSFSQSWIGYHANVYYLDFMTPLTGDRFDQEWGTQNKLSNMTSQNWKEYSTEEVRNYIFDESGVSENSKFAEEAYSTGETFEELKNELLTILIIILEETHSETIETYRDEVKNLKSHIVTEDLISYYRPKGHYASRDNIAFSQGIITPPHILSKCWLYSLKSYFTQIEELSKIADKALLYIRRKNQKTEAMNVSEGKIFIGHGRSTIWQDLSNFLQNRLHLNWDEFNRESTAGITIKERLEAMLDQASFAFLIMTAEDEHSDNTMHARENVIHEIGLFQGRLTFRRAIILLEEGCLEFSNIHGINQIRFPKGNIRAVFEDIREVLEREGII